MRTLRSHVLLLAAVALCVGAAEASVHSLDGNLRFQEGTLLPYPITATPPPKGRVQATPSATAMQTAGPPPKRLTLSPGVLAAPGNDLTIPIFLGGSKLWQVHTAVALSFPGTTAGAAVFSAGGRTGGATETWCPGSGATPPFGCTHPSRGSINGLLRYTATKSQFGGPGRAGLGGSADIALRGGDAAPCSYGGGVNTLCIASMATILPLAPRIVGGPFGAREERLAPGPPSGRLWVTVTAAGLIVAATPTAFMADGIPHPRVGYGGPWTTGMLTVSVTNNVGPVDDVFVLSGSDRRNPAGRGRISLVAGGVADSAVFGPHGDRGWLNLQIGPPPGAHVPGLGPAGLAALAALTGGVGSAFLRRRARGEG